MTRAQAYQQRHAKVRQRRRTTAARLEGVAELLIWYP
jgi:hypothetical protein